jgi:hypothetical protein
MVCPGTARHAALIMGAAGMSLKTVLCMAAVVAIGLILMSEVLEDDRRRRGGRELSPPLSTPRSVSKKSIADVQDSVARDE